MAINRDHARVLCRIEIEWLRPPPAPPPPPAYDAAPTAPALGSSAFGANTGEGGEIQFMGLYLVVYPLIYTDKLNVFGLDGTNPIVFF